MLYVGKGGLHNCKIYLLVKLHIYQVYWRTGHALTAAFTVSLSDMTHVPQVLSFHYNIDTLVFTLNATSLDVFVFYVTQVVAHNKAVAVSDLPVHIEK